MLLQPGVHTGSPAATDAHFCHLAAGLPCRTASRRRTAGRQACSRWARMRRVFAGGLLASSVAASAGAWAGAGLACSSVLTDAMPVNGLGPGFVGCGGSGLWLHMCTSKCCTGWRPLLLTCCAGGRSGRCLPLRRDLHRSLASGSFELPSLTARSQPIAGGGAG